MGCSYVVDIGYKMVFALLFFDVLCFFIRPFGRPLPMLRVHPLPLYVCPDTQMMEREILPSVEHGLEKRALTLTIRDEGSSFVS